MLLMDSLMQMLTIKQDKEEKMIHYTQCFKQAQDNLIQYIGENTLDNFVETTQEYKLTSKESERNSMKAKMQSRSKVPHNLKRMHNVQSYCYKY